MAIFEERVDLVDLVVSFDRGVEPHTRLVVGLLPSSGRKLHDVFGKNVNGSLEFTLIIRKKEPRSP